MSFFAARASRPCQFVLAILLPSLVHAQVIHLKKLDARAPANTVEIRGLTPGPFNPNLWQKSLPHLVPDIRHPILEPRDGQFRNIYAPSVLALEKSYRIFYGGWDGAPTGNDRIYSADTSDFLTFTQRRTVIDHGEFQHVCNCNITRYPQGGFAMMCTLLPDARGHNKPGVFFSADAKVFDYQTPPATAKKSSFIEMQGYANFTAADINGASVLVHDGEKFRLYFNNFADFSKTFRATSEDARHFTFDGPVAEGWVMVNDVKLFKLGGETWYLMGFHHNGDSLMYSLSRDPMKFPAPQPLLKHLDDSDKYIVSLGFVTRGDQNQPNRSLLGILYGAGATPTLDANRIFARWLQKKLVWIPTTGPRVESKSALGPDRALFEASGPGHFDLYSEDGKTLLGRTPPTTLTPGDVYQLTNDK